MNENPDFTDEELTGSVGIACRVLEHWGATADEIRQILATDPAPIVERREIPAGQRDDLTRRVVLIIWMYRVIAMLYPKNPEIVEHWMGARHPRFQGETGLTLMASGLDGFMRIRQALIEDLSH